MTGQQFIGQTLRTRIHALAVGGFSKAGLPVDCQPLCSIE